MLCFVFLECLLDVSCLDRFVNCWWLTSFCGIGRSFSNSVLYLSRHIIHID